jgi:cation transport regulator ChaB
LASLVGKWVAAHVGHAAAIKASVIAGAVTIAVTTIGSLTLANVYNHLLDEMWEEWRRGDRRRRPSRKDELKALKLAKSAVESELRYQGQYTRKVKRDLRRTYARLA